MHPTIPAETLLRHLAEQVARDRRLLASRRSGPRVRFPRGDR